MNITFLGAAHEVTGSCTLLSACGRNILIDCGMEQGADIYENCEIPVAAGDIDFVLLTHAHIDHSGKLPVLCANGYRGGIYATEATVRLCNIMLMDSAHIQEQEAVWRNRKAKRSGKQEYVPLYTTQDVQNTLPLFVPCRYQQYETICEGVRVRFLDAGHLLGSSSVEIEVTESGVKRTVLFSGDIGNVDRPLIRNPQKPDHADYVVIESTYGDRLHGPRPDYINQLTAVIQETLDRGGNVVIPSFAIGRTQELLYLIRQIKEQNAVRGHVNFPVWVDSPLAVEATRIYSGDMMEYYDDATLALIKSGVDVLHFNGLNMSVTSQESMAINSDKTPKVILSASGMCEAGRIRHHLKHNLWRAQSTILFVGYQAEGTLGRALVEGARTVKLFGEEVQVNAQIRTIEGISGHADQRMLLDWLAHLQKAPAFVFVNHGEDRVCDTFAAEVRAQLGFSAQAPFNGAQYDLLTGECLYRGNTAYLEKRTKRRQTTVFDKLVMTGKRLMQVIEKNEGGANKDLAKFTSQITELCNKWDR